MTRIETKKSTATLIFALFVLLLSLGVIIGPIILVGLVVHQQDWYHIVGMTAWTGITAALLKQRLEGSVEGIRRWWYTNIHPIIYHFHCQGHDTQIVSYRNHCDPE